MQTLVIYIFAPVVFVKLLNQLKCLVHLAALIPELTNVGINVQWSYLQHAEMMVIQAMITWRILTTDKTLSEKKSRIYNYIYHVSELWKN